jgi:diguanylate cyclase (GGDEF)-like protein
VTEDASVSAGWAQVKLLREFLALLTRCRTELMDLSKSEIHALCLSALSAAGGGAPAILLWAGEDGALGLELSTGALPGAPAQLGLTLAEEERRVVQEHPARLAFQPSLLRVAREALGRETVFAWALAGAGAPRGALLVIPPAGQSFPSAQLAILEPLAAQIDELLQVADHLAGLVQQSLTDDLTGLYNHRFLHRHLAAEISRASRHGHPLALLFCEVDDFRLYRENRGHTLANRLLCAVAAFLRPRPPEGAEGFCFRTSDLSFRYGGEGFVVLLPETAKAGALTKAERLRAALAAAPIAGREHLPGGRVTLSIGVAAFPQDASDAVSILEAADRALLAARRLGKNRVEGA